MNDGYSRSLAMIEKVASSLGPLVAEFVFVGGATVGLLVEDPSLRRIRTTFDVDLVTEVLSTGDYYQLAERLRSRGFREDSRPEAPICRWVVGGVMVVVVPSNDATLGFSNRWYQETMRTALAHSLPQGRSIRCISPACFLATKLVAFSDRGQGDYEASHDIEDVITLIDGRPRLVEEIRTADTKLRAFVASGLGDLLARPNATFILAGHLGPDAAEQARLPQLRRRLEEIAELCDE
jgi:hypothetical protein